MGHADLQALFTRLVAEAARQTGEGGAPLDARREARTLLALVDGLTSHALIGHLAPDEAEELLHTPLAGLRDRLDARPPETA